MSQLSNVALKSNRASIQLHLTEDIYSKALIGKTVDNGIDGRVRYRQEVKGNVQQLHECFLMAETGR